MTPYSRKLYPHWIGGSRVSAVERDRVKSDEVWICPHTAKVITDSRYIDMDHVISLGEVHRLTGGSWSPELREKFANDPLNMLSVSRSANRSKSDSDGYKWMPAKVAYWRGYLDAREAVRKKYNLGYAPGEKTYIKFFRSKAKRHEKGIKLNRVRAWAGSNLSWVYSPL